MKGEEKKLTIKRIWIFLFFAFIFNMVLGIAFSDKQGGMTSTFFGFTMMCYPAIANIVTRIITKEGVEEHYLKANFKKNKGIYIAAVLTPLFMAFATAIALHLYCDTDTTIAENFNAMLGDFGGVKMFIALMARQYMWTIPLLVLGFGEEFGWRAYLAPKLEKLMPRWASCCIVSMIWGLWHAPLVWYGYDFGTNYWGFPYMGVIIMGVTTIPLSFVLTEMTERTKSIYPASICHMVFDQVMSIPMACMVNGESFEKANSLVTGSITLGFGPLLVWIVILCAKLINKKKAAA